MRRSRALLVAAIVVGVLSACGGSPETAGVDGAKVATLASAGATPVPEATPQRPRARLDMTPDEEEALMVPYFKCLKENGFTFLEAKRAGLGDGSPDAPAELRACEEQFFPLVAWEKDPMNPEAADFEDAVKDCLRQKGIRFDGEGFADNDVTRALDLTPECERKAAESLK
ncbi:hypothetical protein [Micromonospora sp. LOL_024]|uniref:hypothetical protein n=1 Tax=Micromonospora sp. LOL_024 TaxID=3345412 RepID=UPI003A87001F